MPGPPPDPAAGAAPAALLARMLRAAAWANRRVLDALRARPAAEALPLLAHLLAAEHVWLARAEGRPPELAVWPELTLADCARLAAENAAGYARLLERTTAADLAAPVRYRTTQGQEFATPLSDILTQVVLHGAYHRGQIAMVVARAGGAAPNTDFITFAREEEATPP